MNKLLSSFWAFLLLLLLSTNLFAEETVRLTSGEWPPYLSKDSKHYGFASHIVTEAFAQVGIRVEYGFRPWKRAYLLAQRGAWDGSVVWAWSKERAEGFYFSDSVMEAENVFFHRRDTFFNWKTYDDLAGQRIGATSGYYYGDEFEEAEKSGIIKVDKAVSDELGFKKLLKRRIDAFVIVSDVGYTLMSKLLTHSQKTLLTHHPKPVYKTGFSLILSKKVIGNQKLLLRFNRGLEKLNKNVGMYKFIVGLMRGYYD